jgi:hypothetical protein
MFDLVLVGYRAADTCAAIDFCERAFGRGLVRRRLLVLNRPDIANQVGIPLNRWEVIEGTNALGEFSGWQEGLDHLGGSQAGVIFLNDTVTTHRRFRMVRRIAMMSAIWSAPTRAMVGFTDHGAGSFSIEGFCLNHWVSTYCFMLTSDALDALQRSLYCRDLVLRVVPGGLREECFFSGLSPNLEYRLRHEMFDGGWYGGERLSSTNQDRLQLKARCIVAEMLLSARCDVLGVQQINPFHQYPLAARIDEFQQRVRDALSRRLPRLIRARST